MSKYWMRIGLVVLVAAMFVNGGYGQEGMFKLAAMGAALFPPTIQPWLSR